jgi:hypothetical protein
MLVGISEAIRLLLTSIFNAFKVNIIKIFLKLKILYIRKRDLLYTSRPGRPVVKYSALLDLSKNLVEGLPNGYNKKQPNNTNPDSFNE